MSYMKFENFSTNPVKMDLEKNERNWQNKTNPETEPLESGTNYFSEVISWKSTLAQWIAGFSFTLSNFGMGMMGTLPVLAIGELKNSHSELSLTDEEASWFGSLKYLLQPVTCVLGTFLQPYIGRKYGLIFTFIPQLISWLILPYARTVGILYLTVFLFGISAGCAEAPGITYLGEATEPRIRGVINGFFNIGVSFGVLIESLLGAVFNWRTTAAISAALPVLGICLVAQMPESPIWLLTKGKKKDALKSLRWLRGWTSADNVKIEFEELSRYVENSNMSENDNSGKSNNSKTQTIWTKWKSTMAILCKRNMWQPLSLIILCHFFSLSVSLASARPFILEVFRSLHVPIKPQLFLFINTILEICGGFIFMWMVKFTGKRKLMFISLTACSIICVILSGYSFFIEKNQLVWIPTIMFPTLHLFSGIGSRSVPWILASEVFPVSGRSLGAGLSAASFYILAFSLTKSFRNLNAIIHLPGCFLLYGSGGLIGLLYLYYYLPETEGKTLAEIEEFFSKQSKKSRTSNT